MSLKIKKSLHSELIKIKRQKKGIAAYLISKGYSTSYANNLSKNWKEVEVIADGTSASKSKTKTTTTKTKAKVTSKKASSSKSKTKKPQVVLPEVIVTTKTNNNTPSVGTVITSITTPSVPPPLPTTHTTSATEIKEVLDTVAVEEPEKDLVLNISEGFEVKAEVQVKQLSHPKFFLGSLVKILQKSGAKVTFNAGLDLNNSNEKLDGFTLAINEVH